MGGTQPHGRNLIVVGRCPFKRSLFIYVKDGLKCMVAPSCFAFEIQASSSYPLLVQRLVRHASHTSIEDVYLLKERRFQQGAGAGQVVLDGLAPINLDAAQLFYENQTGYGCCIGRRTKVIEFAFCR